ncbi:MAG: ArsC/Spx/MgsR family protein [Acidithiobacillus sp.]
MASIIFYEKPGCRNNARQKDLLRAAGHTLEVRDLLSEAWSQETLRPFFGDRAVAEWFNRAAPRVKSGEVIPEALDAGQALALMIADPLLIRRPLMESEGRCMTGFEPEQVGIWIPLSFAGYPEIGMTAPESCLRPAPCPLPEQQVGVSADQAPVPTPS